MSRIRLSVTENVLRNPSRVTVQMYEDYLGMCGRGCVAEVDGEIAGFSSEDCGDGSIWALFVDPRHEGKGLAQALLRLAVDWLFEQGHETVRLDTTAGTRAGPPYFTRCFSSFLASVRLCIPSRRAASEILKSVSASTA